MALRRQVLLAALPLMLGSQLALGQPAKKPAGKPAPAAVPAKPAPEVKVDVAAARKDLLYADVDRAASAAALLGRSLGPAALDALLDALSLGVAPKVAIAALEALAAHHAGISLDTLLHYVRHRNPEVRAKAVLALGTLDDKRAVVAWKEAFTDGDVNVRAAAAQVAALRKDRSAAEPMLKLLAKGDAAMASALAAVATPEIAKKVAELIGEAPDALVADCLGSMLLRTDLGREDVYVEIVRAIGKIPGDEAVIALTAFIGAVPENPPRQSRREAQVIYEQRLGGGN